MLELKSTKRLRWAYRAHTEEGALPDSTCVWKWHGSNLHQAQGRIQGAVCYGFALAPGHESLCGGIGPRVIQPVSGLGLGLQSCGN